MLTLKENHLEWALKHLQHYSHSDFYPRMFELQAIFHNWANVKEYILAIDLSKYVPKPATTSLAYKNNRTYRIVHQLEPIDTFIYTALIRDICEIVEAYRIPLEAALSDESVDLCLLIMGTIGIPRVGVNFLGDIKNAYPRKPIAVCMIGVQEIYNQFCGTAEEVGIPVFPSVRRAVNGLAALYRYSQRAGM